MVLGVRPLDSQKLTYGSPGALNENLCEVGPRQCGLVYILRKVGTPRWSNNFCDNFNFNVVIVVSFRFQTDGSRLL